MEIKKNECYEISIVDMAEDGQGIGKIGDFVVFVKDTVIGDVAKVKLVKVLKHYGFGRFLCIQSDASSWFFGISPFLYNTLWMGMGELHERGQHR